MTRNIRSVEAHIALTKTDSSMIIYCQTIKGVHTVITIPVIYYNLTTIIN